MNDEEIDRYLSQWQVDVPEDSHFRSAVWREIAMRDSGSFSRYCRELLEKMMRPRLGIPLGATALFLTVSIAVIHGTQNREKTWDELAQSYAQRIDPVTHSGELHGSLHDH